jgi:hypothetical protein
MQIILTQLINICLCKKQRQKNLEDTEECNSKRKSTLPFAHHSHSLPPTTDSHVSLQKISFLVQENILPFKNQA